MDTREFEWVKVTKEEFDKFLGTYPANYLKDYPVRWATPPFVLFLDPKLPQPPAIFGAANAAVAKKFYECAPIRADVSYHIASDVLPNYKPPKEPIFSRFESLWVKHALLMLLILAILVPIIFYFF